MFPYIGWAEKNVINNSLLHNWQTNLVIECITYMDSHSNLPHIESSNLAK